MTRRRRRHPVRHFYSSHQILWTLLAICVVVILVQELS